MRPNNNNNNSNNNNNRKNYGNNKNNRFRNNNGNKPNQPVRGYDGESEMVSPNQKRHAQNQQTKYNDLAKNARQAGDRVECEYYMQHADHYTRIINLADEQQRRRDGVEQSHEHVADADAYEDNAVQHTSQPQQHEQHADQSGQAQAGQPRKKIARKMRAPYSQEVAVEQIQNNDFLTKEEKLAVQVALEAEARFAQQTQLPKIKKHPNVQPQTNPHYKTPYVARQPQPVAEAVQTQDMPVVKKRRGRPPKAKVENQNSGLMLESVLPIAHGE